MRNRPFGVTLLAILAVISGILSICGGLGSFFSFGLGLVGSLLGIGEAGGLGSGLYGLIWGIVTILLGIGLWNLHRWGWLGTIFFQAINLLYALLAIFTPPHVPWISAVISVIIIWYLTRPAVRAAFR